MRETKTIQVEGAEYTITQLGALKGRKVLLRAVRLVAPVIKSTTDPEAMIAAVLADIDGADLDFVCDTFASVPCKRQMLQAKMPTMQTVPFNFDEEFAGNYVAMFEWLTEHLKLNFSSFLAGMVAKMATLAPPPVATDAPSNGQPESIPTSGA